MRAAYERGREPVRTILDEELALCVLRLELSGAEAVLVAHGHQQAVCSQRDAFEHALAPTLSAAVERATGRTVTTVLSTTQRRSHAHAADLPVRPPAATWERLSGRRARRAPAWAARTRIRGRALLT